MKPVSANIANIAGSHMVPSVRQRSMSAGQGSIAANSDVKYSASVEAPAQTGGADHSEKVLQEAVDKMNRQIQQVTREVHFSVDKSSDRVVIKVIDHQTKEVIRQIPSEEILSMAEELDKLSGMLLKEKA